MNKTKFLTIVVIGLVLLNIVVISFFLMRKRPLPHQAIRKTIIERLHFDTQQASDYELLIGKHRNGIQQKESELIESKKQLYTLLQGTDFSKKDSLIHQICLIQQDIEGIHFQHFQEIKSLCRAEQIADFNAFTEELGGLFAPKKKIKH